MALPDSTRTVPRDLTPSSRLSQLPNRSLRARQSTLRSGLYNTVSSELAFAEDWFRVEAEEGEDDDDEGGDEDDNSFFSLESQTRGMAAEASSI